MKKIIPIILCGGSGTRLWPLSRETFPKQFLDLSGNGEKSLLQKTQERISNIENVQSPILICNEDHRFLVAEQMRDIGIKPKAIILEPSRKNTAPAITLGALKAIEEGDDSILLVLSADHKIDDNVDFIKAIKAGSKYAQKGRLVTFGIVPSYPETGFGYIESEVQLDKNDLNGSKIKNFIEKPDKKLAEKLIKDKKYSWNSGMFIFQANFFLDELLKYSPLVHKHCKKALEKSVTDLDFIRIENSLFAKSPNISIDFAVMEKTSLGTVIPLDVGWSDIGSWKSLWESEKKDSLGNVLKGKVISESSKNCYLRSENRLIVGIGLEDLVVVETSDAILVSKKEYSNTIKRIVEELKEKGHEESYKHRKIYRPWGSYISVVEDDRWQVKKIEVKAGAQLSLQMHHHRAEHWILVSGIAKVQINEETKLISENQSVYIPVGAKHRLTNPGKIPLILIEVQSGTYLGEDDIIRFEDNYGRGANSD